MINDSVLNAVQQALVTILRGNVALQTHLYERPVGQVADAFLRVYEDGTVPASLVGRWVTIGDNTETWARAFFRSGSQVGTMLHVWHTPVPGDDVGKAVAQEAWRLVARALSAPLALVGAHTMLVGYAELVTTTKDPDGQSWHIVGRYAATTRRTTNT